MACESDASVGKTPQIIMPNLDTRLAILASVHQQHDHCIDMDVMRSSPWLPVSGGSINQTYRLDLGLKSLFVKLHQAQYMPMFEAEADGLKALRAANAIRVPEVYACACNENASWLVMAYIPLASHTCASEKLFGQQLAHMHHCMGDAFGWFRDNTIGSTAQINTTDHDWQYFYREHRLAYQLKLAKNNGFTASLQNKGQRLMADLHVFFTNYEAQPSLLHGDLWSGNHAIDDQAKPIIFDPAVYYGDREVDIAMTELFGGLSADFYAAYHEVYPLDAGYHVRKTLYNLYHILNHANLFGGSYAHQAESMMDQLLSEY